MHIVSLGVAWVFIALALLVTVKNIIRSQGTIREDHQIHILLNISNTLVALTYFLAAFVFFFVGALFVHR